MWNLSPDGIRLGMVRVIDMDILSVIRSWALRDKLPIRDDFAADWSVAKYD